jgi:hypothetical protein
MIHHDINGAYVEDNEFKDHEDTTALNEEMKIPVRPPKKQPPPSSLSTTAGMSGETDNEN